MTPAVDGKPASHPSFSLALGGGGARGLAHIVAIEALDELGVRPRFIAGASMGALVGATYASGMSGRELRDYAFEVLGNRIDTARRLLRHGRSGLTSLFDFNPFRSAFIDGETLLDIILPPGTADEFRLLDIPMAIVATDFYDRSERDFDGGPLKPALAASIALPGVITPQIVDGRVLIDGGVSNPLPVDHLTGRGRISVAVDLTAGGSKPEDGVPSTTDAMFGTIQIMQHAITRAKLAEHPVDVLIRPDVARFRVLDFFRVRDVLAASEPVKDELKRKLEDAFTRASA
ncbi:MAG: patatin-like phospholipase family protein [Hyphomicrobiales bacterium]